MSEVNYEWDMETVDPESGDILDHNHADKLVEFKEVAAGEALVLVRDVWEEDGELSDRSHWYPFEDDKPVFFPSGVDVPKRFIKELDKWRRTE
jgi:hypothetical protein